MQPTRRQVRSRGVVAALGTLLLVLLVTPSGGAGAAGPVDRLRAANVVPPGESGLDTLANFAGTTAGVTANGPHVDDQLGLYAAWQYKSMQMTGPMVGSPVPGDPAVTVWRDPQYGVPTITATNDADAFYGLGYAMAQDRLFQMEVFRHVGAGTLAALIGASGLPMDVSVRRFTEGAAGRRAEFDAMPAGRQLQLRQFVDGVNADIAQVQTDPRTQPAEFTLLGDQPIAPWTADDVLSFGEYAGRFFGQFSGADLSAAATYLGLVQRLGQAKAELAFDDLYALQDPHAPTSLSAAQGAFPRHVGRAVAHRFAASPYANHDPSLLPSLASVRPVAAAAAASLRAIRTAQRLIGLPRWGSNAAVVSGRLTADGRPMLYGGPQTGWAVPGFFWEAEVHDPVRAERGVMVPDIPLFVIGRSNDTAWTVTSALDANADVFTEQLDAGNRTYLHNGQRLTVAATTQTLPCNNPPTAATALLSARAPTLCPVPATTLTVWRTVHGPALGDPDSGHRLYTLQSGVDGRLLSSLGAWDAAGQSHDVRSFGSALATMSLGFNFFYVDAHGSIGYWHTGRYPIRARNADPTLPMPGTGEYDWQGVEQWSAHPHAVDPAAGYVVNWNNKPAVGWWSPSIVGELVQPDRWGDTWESVPLAAAIATGPPLTFTGLGQLPRAVAYVDNRARVLLPLLRASLRRTRDPALASVAGYLAGWDGRRDQVTAGRYGPAVTFFDRFFEHLQSLVLEPQLGSDYGVDAGLVCPAAPCHYVSVDNLDAATYKYEGAPAQTLLAALDGRTRFDWLARAGGRSAVLSAAAAAAANELTQADGGDPARWTEPAEATTFSAQGAISVPPITPFQNRGSYGQVIEATGAPDARRAAVRRGAAAGPLPRSAAAGALPAAGSGGLPATGPGGLPAVAALLTGAGLLLGRRRADRARRGARAA